MSAHYASADEPTLRDRTWLEQQWDIAGHKANERKTGELLVLDEIQKVPNWSSVVKMLWDADTRSGVPLKVVLLGSAPLLIQSGLTESLAGRFEVIAVPHWSFTEMREAFGWNPALVLICSIPVWERASASPIGASETMKWTSFYKKAKRRLQSK